MPVIYEPKGKAQEYAHLAINHYVGCGHGCMYCYVPNITRNTTFHTEQKPKANILDRIRKEAPKHAGTDKRVLLCFSTDPYQPLDVDLAITRKVIQILKDYDIPFQILTKGGIRAVRDFDLYGPDDAFATTLTFLDPDKSKLNEPNAATPDDRIIAIAAAKKEGIKTWVSLEPVIDGRETLKIIEATHNIVDHYKVGPLNYSGQQIDWRQFGIAAINTFERLKKSYYIKAELAKYLDGIYFKNTDTRTIKRS